jgi:1,4-dihydroxy-2-naphthoyl-CoA hydrolase
MSDQASDKSKSRNFMMKPDQQPPCASFMGMKILEVTPEKVTAELLVTNNLTNRNGVMHGGAVMAFADNLGGTAATANLPAAGGSTATIESKTNFFAPIPQGDKVRAVCTPLHTGRTTIVLQTNITRGDGRLAAMVTQTQIVLPKKG